MDSFSYMLVHIKILFVLLHKVKKKWYGSSLYSSDGTRFKIKQLWITDHNIKLAKTTLHLLHCRATISSVLNVLNTWVCS